ncbi:MAG: SH3 domain-containing protein [Thermosynechococcaceae cyanobacterium MS004]|nr:SH3 domain-containing protein [Thermosynechococcaceae cyanobacterium MS004]
MEFSRLARFSVLAITLISTGFCFPALAGEKGELIAEDAKAQINVRSLANTNADIVAAGAVGDRVEILEHSVGNEGLIWYRVRLKSKQSGWVRGDLIKVLGSPAPKAKAKPTASPQPSAQGVSKSSAAKSNPVKPSAVKPSATKPTVALVRPTPPASPQSIAPPAKPPAPSPAASQPPSSSAAIAPSALPAPSPASPTTLIAFQTPTFSVRVFAESGQLRLNLFNRKTQAVVLNAVPVQSKSTQEGTTYSYQSDIKVTVLAPASGQPKLSATALGSTLEEQPEAAAPSESPAAAPASATPAPTTLAPTTPAPTTPAPAPVTPAPVPAPATSTP